jgi:hypothetical protein
VILFRCFAWDASVEARARGGPLWFPRMLQGEGRHDNPGLYGCLYTAVEPVSAAVEQLASLAGTFLEAADLYRHGRPRPLAALELTQQAPLLDIVDPPGLAREHLRPSRVATNRRSITQASAADFFKGHTEALGVRWWSTFESLWANVTLFDRAAPAVDVADVQPLDVGDDVVVEAADFLGLSIST